MSELLRCANCLAPVRLDVGPVVTCSYCRAQTRVDAPTVVAKPPAVSGRRLAETIAFVTPSMKKIPFLAKARRCPSSKPRPFRPRTTIKKRSR